MMPDSDQVDVLMEGVDAWNLWRSKHPYVRPNLRGFSTRMLHPSILGLDLRKANFENADLQGADLYRCWLVEANFIRADLRGATLGEVTAGGAHFDRAKMKAAVMMNGIYFGATFKHTDFIVPAHRNETPDLRPTMLNNADLQECDFTRAKLQAAILKGVNLRGANLAHANLRDANLEFVQLMGFGATAHGKMRVYKQKGAPLPDGWAFDKDGYPTTDVEKALAGLIQPVGGHKGVGLAIMMGMLSTLLSGASYGTELGNMEDGAKPGRDGQVFVAIEAAAFRPLDAVRHRVDAVSRQIRTSRRTAGVDKLYPPGRLEAEFERERAMTGIPLNDETIGDIEKTAQRLRVSSFDTYKADLRVDRID